MALKAILETLDDVPEEIKKEYKEQTLDGKVCYVLDVEGVDTLPSVKNLKTAHESVKKDKRELTAKLQTAEEKLEGLPEDFNAQAYEELKAKAEGKEPPKTDEQVAQVRRQLEEKHNRELGKKDERIIKLEAKLNRTIVDDALTSALVEAGVAKEFLAAAKAMLKDKGIIKLKEEDEEFKANVETDMGPMDIAAFIKDWTASEEGKVFVTKPAGGGASGSDGRKTDENPWAKDTVSLTKQGQIVRENKDKARTMMKAAGKTDAEIKQVLGG